LAHLQSWYDNFPANKLYWPDRHYASLLQTDDNWKTRELLFYRTSPRP